MVLHYCFQTAMPGMKTDCGGAAAILGAFKAAVKQVGIVVACMTALVEAKQQDLRKTLDFMHDALNNYRLSCMRKNLILLKHGG